MAAEQIGAASDLIEQWITDAKAGFTDIGEEFKGITTTIGALRYSGPNADIVEQGTEENVKALGAASSQNVSALMAAVAQVASLVLGAGGSDVEITGFEEMTEFDIPDNGWTSSPDVMIDLESFRAARATIETHFNQIDTIAGNIVSSLQEIDRSRWVGQARDAVEKLVEEKIGAGQSNLALNPSAKIGAEGVETVDYNEDMTTMGLYSAGIANIINTLFAQENTAVETDEQAAAATQAV